MGSCGSDSDSEKEDYMISLPETIFKPRRSLHDSCIEDPDPLDFLQDFFINIVSSMDEQKEEIANRANDENGSIPSNATNTIIPVYLPRDHYDKFDPMAYLRDFYTNVGTKNAEGAMVLIVHYLPSLVARIPAKPGLRLLDVGAGPTINMAVSFRNKVSQIYLSDYSDRNREVLMQWWLGRSPFDWTAVLERFRQQEGTKESLQEIENTARQKVQGVLHCDVFDGYVIGCHDLGQFDIVTTTYCIEYASSTADEYYYAIQNVVGLIKPGGYLLMGGIYGENCYQFGGVRFMSHLLSEDEMFNALNDAGIDTESCCYYHNNGIFLILARKMEEEIEVDDDVEFEDFDDDL